MGFISELLLLSRRRNPPLPFKVLLAGLISKLIWGRLTGELKFNNTDASCVHGREPGALTTPRNGGSHHFKYTHTQLKTKDDGGSGESVIG